MLLPLLCKTKLKSVFFVSSVPNLVDIGSADQLHKQVSGGTMPVEKEKASWLVEARSAAFGWKAKVDHISDHRPARSTWKRWRQEVRKAGDIGAESTEKGRKESEKIGGPGCREFEPCHSDHEKRLLSRENNRFLDF